MGVFDRIINRAARGAVRSVARSVTKDVKNPITRAVAGATTEIAASVVAGVVVSAVTPAVDKAVDRAASAVSEKITSAGQNDGQGSFGNNVQYSNGDTITTSESASYKSVAEEAESAMQSAEEANPKPVRICIYCGTSGRGDICEACGAPFAEA